MILRSWGIGFNEWNSAFLYLTDLLILTLILAWFLRTRVFYAMSQSTRVEIRNIFSFNYDWFLIGFLVISAISIKNAINPALGFYQLIKLVEFSLLYFYVKSNLGVVFNLATAFFVFLASGIFQAILSILQYVKQSDLGLRFLGETILNSDLFNVAVFTVEGEKVMRAYGTLPHPNVLAFFLFISIFIFYFLYISRINKSGKELWFWLVGYAILIFGLFFTFSRIIIFVWLIGVIYRFGWLYWKNEFRGIIQRSDVKKLALVTLVLVFVFSLLFWPQVLARIKISPQEEALSLRGFYNQIAFQGKPFFGVGPGNFVNWLKEKNPGLALNLYQPVHNIYLLIFSETGILGLAALLLFLFFLIKNYLRISFNRPFHYSLFIIFTSVLFLGLFDHFLWTLQQGQIIFWLVSGLLAAMSPRSLTG